MLVAPDLATIEAGVTNDADSARAAADANNVAIGKVLLAVKGTGVPDADVQTARLSLIPQYSQSRGGANAITGYRASNRVVVKVRDVTKAAAMVDTMVAAGANEIGGIGFSVSQPSFLLDQAREQAVADARRKAEIYARAAGVTLGPAISISEDSAPPAAPLRRMSAAMAASAPVAPGEETLRVSVIATWAIKPP